MQMRPFIKGKHLGGAVTVDQKTGEETPSKGSMMMLPAREGTCAECASEHTDDLPHNAGSLFYQYKFFNEHGKWPTWKDAMSHCTDDMKNFWTAKLSEKGITV